MELTPKNIIVTDDLIVKYLAYNSSSDIRENTTFLTTGEKERIKTVRSFKRKQELFFSRLLWSKMNGQVIDYKRQGSPILAKGEISISHSNRIVSIAFSKNEKFGIDLEAVTPKIDRIKSKFLHPDEEVFLKEQFRLNLTKIWSAKESAYKLLGIIGLSFKESLKTVSMNERFGKIDVNHPKYKGSVYFRVWYNANLKMVCTLASTSDSIYNLQTEGFN